MLEQQLHDVRAPALCRLVESGPALVRRLGISDANQTRVIREESAQRLDVALGTGLEEEGDAVCLPPLDLGLQGAPTREAMVLGDGRERHGKLRSRVYSP